jgi:hypothetical protein
MSEPEHAEVKAPVLPLSAQIRIAAEMSPPYNRGLAAMMLEEWVPEAERLEGAVEALKEALDLAAEALDVPRGYRRRLTALRERTRTLRGVGDE